MAFFAEDGELVRDMWPGGLGRPVIETEGMLGVPTWRVLPTSYDALCDRVSVDGAATRQPRVILSHTGLETRGRLVQLSVRLQGVVGAVNLGVNGNWRGFAEHVPKAVQYLRLESGDDLPGGDPDLLNACREAFRAQRRGIVHIEAIVRNALGVTGSGDVGKGGKVNLRRRVFSKVRMSGMPKAIRLDSHEDPGGLVKRMEREWVIDHRVKTAVQASSGNFMVTNPLAIRRGDFVDVAALLTIVVHGGRYGQGREIMLSPLEVVRLRKANEVKALLRGPDPRESMASGRDELLDVVTGFDIADNADVNEDDEDMRDAA